MMFNCKYCNAISSDENAINMHEHSCSENPSIKDFSFKDSSKNNGGETDYYKIDPKWTTHQDVIEAREMNYAQGNIYKVACTFNIGRHEATDYERELNKIIFFANRELNRIKNDNTD